MLGSRKLYDVAHKTLSQIQSLVVSQNCSLFMFSQVPPDFHNSDQLMCQKTTFDGKYIDGCTLATASQETPQFKAHTVRMFQHKATFMSCPIFSLDGQMFLNVQISKQPKKSAVYVSKGFSQTEEIIFKLICQFLQVKIQNLELVSKIEIAQGQTVATIGLASAVCSQRSYIDLVLEAQKVLPKFMCFQGLSILFHDRVNKTLIRINTDMDEDEIEFFEMIRKKKIDKVELTYSERIKDFERQLKKRQQQVYPLTLGLTGKAFRTGEVQFHNDMKEAQGFMPTVDNLTGTVNEVNNIMIVPVFGQKDEDPNRKPAAILQFINKIDE